MKALKLLWGGILALLALGACNHEDPENNPDNEYDDAYYASLASVSSLDSNFTATDKGGTIYFKTDGGSVTVNVDCGTEWTAENSASNLFSTSLTTTSLTVTAVQNTVEEELSATITFYTAAQHVEFASVTVIQDAAEAEESEETEESLILVYNLTSANSTITLALGGTVDCTVYWGDGSDVEHVSDIYPSHTYTSAGEYRVVINGTVTSLDRSPLGNNLDDPDTTLIAVEQWGNTGLTSLFAAFFACDSLKYIPADLLGAFAEVTTAKYAFDGCKNLPELPEGLFAHAGKCTEFYATFLYCSSLKTLPADLFANCVAAEDFEYVFEACPSIEEIPAGLFDNCTNASNFNDAFVNCESLKTLPSRLFANCAVTSLRSVFSKCYGLKTIPADLFEGCSAVTEMFACFSYDTGLEEIPAGLFDSCSSAQKFSSTFFYCTSLKSLPSRLFANCPSAWYFYVTFAFCTGLETLPSELFYGCSGQLDFGYTFEDCFFTELPEDLFAGCPNANAFHGTFNECNKLTDLPEGLFASNTEATYFGYLFQNCTGLTNVPHNIFSNNKKAYYFAYTFSGCSALSCESPYEVIDGVNVHLYERNDYPDVYETVTTRANCFRSCTGLSDYYNIPSIWGGGKEEDSAVDGSAGPSNTINQEVIGSDRSLISVIDEIDEAARPDSPYWMTVSF